MKKLKEIQTYLIRKVFFQSCFSLVKSSADYIGGNCYKTLLSFLWMPLQAFMNILYFKGPMRNILRESFFNEM